MITEIAVLDSIREAALSHFMPHPVGLETESMFPGALALSSGTFRSPRIAFAPPNPEPLHKA